jgi:2-acylglycerol O-acyltransferase 2
MVQVYKATPPETDAFDLMIAYFTLSGIFAISWSYFFTIPYTVYYIYYHQNVIILVLLSLVFSSIWWGKKRWNWIVNGYIFQTWRQFFKFRVYKESVLDPSQSYLFASYPHGLFPMTLPLLAGVCKESVLPELKHIPLAAIASMLFYTPVMAPLCYWLGCIPATHSNIKATLENKVNNIVLMPDGIIGAYHSHSERETVYVKHRKGFIRIALETGSNIVPVYNFGHTQLFDIYPSSPHSFLVKLSRKIGFAICTFLGPFWLVPFIPTRTEMIMAIGEPIVVKKTENPTKEEIDTLHGVYIEKLIQLYELHKGKHPDYMNKKLEII